MPTPLFRFGASLAARVLHRLPVLRNVRCRYDDVRQILMDDEGFDVAYVGKLTRILDIPIDALKTGDRAFMLTMTDGAEHAAQRRRLSAGITQEDLDTRLPDAMQAAVERHLPETGPFDGLATLRNASNDVMFDYFGLPCAPEDLYRMAEDADILFRFQFADPGNDADLAAKALPAAARLRDLTRAQLEAPRAGSVMARYIEAGVPTQEVHTAITTFVIAGAPQLTIAAAGVLDTLLRRPADGAAARAAAVADRIDDLRAIAMDTLRLAPVAPLVERVAREEVEIGPGAPWAHRIKPGETVRAALLSAMLDKSRVSAPLMIDPNRPDAAMAAFGLGRHRCFAERIARATLPALIAPFLRRTDLLIPRGGGVARSGGLPVSFRLELA